MTVRPLGLMLAGGQARRMGGGDKSLLRLGPDTILDRIAARIAPHCCGIAISIRGDPARWRSLPYLVLPDAVEPASGPLGGVLAGLEHVSTTHGGDGWLLTVPGDTPFLPADLVPRLMEVQSRTDARVCRAASHGRIHPVVALWSAGMRPLVERALATGGSRSVAALQATVHSATAEWHGDSHDPFFNVNTPDDLREAARLASFTSCGS